MDALYPYLMPTKDEQEMDQIQIELEEKGIDNLAPDEKEQLREIRKMKGESTKDLEFSAEAVSELKELEEQMNG